MTRRLTLAILAAALLGALVLSPAPAKGPIEGSLEGPGLEDPLRFAWTHGAGVDDPRRAPFEHVALATGLMTAVFADASVARFDAASRGLRLEPPRGELGPRYTLTHRFEGPGGREIVQHVYPYAKPRPVLFIAPRSWFVARPGLRQALVEAGLPSADRGEGPWSLGVGLAALGAALAAGAVLRSLRVGGARAST
jgi:hypothetical protein